MVANYKKRIESASSAWLYASSTSTSPFGGQLSTSRSNKPAAGADDNGDDMDGITQEYYKFYASSSFASHRLNSSSSLLDTSASLVRSALGFMLANSSSSIIVLAGLFVFSSALLLAVITLKHVRHRNNSSSGGGSGIGSGQLSHSKLNQKLILASSSSSNNSSHLDGDHSSHGGDSTADHVSTSECTTNISSSSVVSNTQQQQQQPPRLSQSTSQHMDFETSHYLNSQGQTSTNQLVSFERKSSSSTYSSSIINSDQVGF